MDVGDGGTDGVSPDVVNETRTAAGCGNLGLESMIMISRFSRKWFPRCVRSPFILFLLDHAGDKHFGFACGLGKRPGPRC